VNRRVCDAVGRVTEGFPEGAPVGGVTSLGDHVYVLRRKSADQIEVYDAESGHPLRRLTVPELHSGEDIVACEHNRCAYVSEYSHNWLHRVTLPDAELTSRWTVHDDRPWGLSLTLFHTLLVTCRNTRSVKEYSTDGQLLRELALPEDVVNPWHAVQLFGGQLLVCHGGRDDHAHRVCLLDPAGTRLDRWFGGASGAGSERVNVASRLAVDKNGFFYVADVNNFRVLLLSPALTLVRQVLSREQLQWRPYRLLLDVARRRLYVAVNEFKDDKFTAGRVVIFST